MMPLKWALAVVLTGLPLVAGTIPPGDPQMELDAPSGGGGGAPPPTLVFAVPFTFISPSGTSPGTSSCMFQGTPVQLCEFVNSTGSDITSLFISALPGSILTSCGTVFGFTDCDVLQQGSAGIPSVLMFSGGIGWRDSAALKFRTFGWDANTAFTISTTPEPTTFWLLPAGAGLLMVRRRRRTSVPPGRGTATG